MLEFEFVFGEFSCHFQNSNSSNIREFEYEFELGEFTPTPGLVTATPIKTKSMELESVKEFKVMLEKQFECTVKCFHSDNGGEYTPVEKYAKQAGIVVTRSAPYTPQSNGVAECMNRTLIESVRTTLLQSGLPEIVLGGSTG
jgi:hypothetical protein